MNTPATYQHLFGPVPSRRLGLSLGLDLNPVKVCTENCIFCQIAPTNILTTEIREWVPTAAVLAEWNHWRTRGGKADIITLSGSGEPTLHSHFGEILMTLRQTGAPRTALFTNGTLLHRAEIREAATQADIVKITLSSPDDDTFHRIHRPAPGISLRRLLSGARQFRQEYSGTLWLEIMLLPGYNDAPEQIRALALLAESIHPDAIHLNTATRPPLAGVPVQALSPAALKAAARYFTPTAKIPTLHTPPDLRNLSDADLLATLSRHAIPLAIFQQAYAAAPAELTTRLQRLHLRVDDHHGIPTVFPPGA